uniref:winged helix-turn-helix domain-containing protein n=1 Tax=Haloprofundus sp. MHR1 TaxID=2572921 RepID=UPI001F332C23|nr:helix-turn-helix domain-containing protein [Haloprofundus sp. MHR1]
MYASAVDERTMRNEQRGSEILALLGDDVSRTILAATDRQPLSAQTLEERCDASLATIYRRIEDLLAHRLLRERTELRSDGNHYKTFEANLEQVDVSLDDGSLAVDVARRDDAPDRFRGIWDSMQRGFD